VEVLLVLEQVTIIPSIDWLAEKLNVAPASEGVHTPINTIHLKTEDFRRAGGTLVVKGAHRDESATIATIVPTHPRDR
jgi:hypothetical protein